MCYITEYASFKANESGVIATKLQRHGVFKAFWERVERESHFL